MTRVYPVYVVDDDPNVRNLLCMLCEEKGLACQTFADGEAFVSVLEGLEPGCVLLDMRLPRRNGLQVQAALAERKDEFAVVAITGHGYVDMAVESMKLGAIDFLEKPFANDVFFDALDRALAKLGERDRSSQQQV